MGASEEIPDSHAHKKCTQRQKTKERVDQNHDIKSNDGLVKDG